MIERRETKKEGKKRGRKEERGMKGGRKAEEGREDHETLTSTSNRESILVNVCD